MIGWAMREEEVLFFLLFFFSFGCMKVRLVLCEDNSIRAGTMARAEIRAEIAAAGYKLSSGMRPYLLKGPRASRLPPRGAPRRKGNGKSTGRITKIAPNQK